MWVEVKELKDLFERLRKKRNKLFAGLGPVSIVKNCDYFQDFCHRFLLCGPPSRQIRWTLKISMALDRTSILALDKATKLLIDLLSFKFFSNFLVVKTP